MEEIIRAHLNEIESSENVRIVYACESGSRAWGFPSADSDYDVRFLYVRPVEWYLSIQEKRDVIERPIHEGLDISGWDLKKALQLFRKSNPPLMEWLGSPIVYLEETSVASRMRALAAEYYLPTACLYHYWNMARGNFRDYLSGEEVSPKKYFYALRPLLAMQWIEQDLGVVPTEFQILVERLIAEPDLKAEIARLIEAKRAGAERDKRPKIAPLSAFIESELERWERQEITGHKKTLASDKLDALFRESIREVWQTQLEE